MDTLGRLLALVVTPPNERDRVQMEWLAGALEAAGQQVDLAYVNWVTQKKCTG